jgi:Ca2+-transporting ATPase
MSNNNSTSSIHSISQHESSSIKVDMRDSLTTPHSNSSNPFAFIPDQLAALQDPKNIELLHLYGGLKGLEKGLHADTKTGLNPNTSIDSNITLNDVTNDKDQLKEKTEYIEDIDQPKHHEITHDATGPYAKRIAIFGSNVLPPVKGKSLLQLMWMAFNDKTLVNINI